MTVTNAEPFCLLFQRVSMGTLLPPSHGSHQALELRGLAGEQVGVDAQSGENGLVAGTEHSLL